MNESEWHKGFAREFSYFTAIEIIKAYQNMYKKYGHAFLMVCFI